MDHSDRFDRPRRQPPPRYPVPAPQEGSGVPYDEYAPFEQIAAPLSSWDGDGPWPMSTEDASPPVEVASPPVETGSGGLLAGSVTGILGAAVALGVANLAAAFIRPQASPIMAVREISGNGRTVPLLALYVAIALVAMMLGMIAWRVPAGAAGIGLLGLLGGFAVLTRPGSHLTDAIPSLAGGITAFAVSVWLIRAGRRRTAYESPARELLGDESPAYESLADEPLADEPPGYESLVFGSPAYASPNYESPAHGSPAHGSPAYRTGWTA